MIARKSNVSLGDVLAELRSHAKLMRKMGAKAFTVDIHGIAMECSFHSDPIERAGAIGFMVDPPQEDWEED